MVTKIVLSNFLQNYSERSLAVLLTGYWKKRGSFFIIRIPCFSRLSVLLKNARMFAYGFLSSRGYQIKSLISARWKSDYRWNVPQSVCTPDFLFTTISCQLKVSLKCSQSASTVFIGLINWICERANIVITRNTWMYLVVFFQYQKVNVGLAIVTYLLIVQFDLYKSFKCYTDCTLRIMFDAYMMQCFGSFNTN